MPKQLNVTLSFTADANAAKKEIQSLQQALNSLAVGKNLNWNNGSGLSDLDNALMKARASAAELQAQLESAMNPKTGKLDLNRFNASLKQSGKTLKDYGNELALLGPKGMEAFNGMTRAIVNAEAPIFRVNSKIKELGVTLANTARWQLSSSIVHGLMGGVQKAYYYAQKLNRSLNDIRIVTGYSAEQMKDFAVEANRAAKALSTTTTNYTNASLIYYQQGLSDEEVKKRTDATIKMANVAGVSAETVADQMTAVWNNFAQGSDNLEYFADVLVKLGAYTASSTDEITQGLEKFSSVAQTIGLSYEYASSALATITATTRESADVAGTALRTLFSRIQGLTLGETQDDGTNLNKYSEALSKVGINIKDTSGELKDMDTILNELGDKWTTLRRDQQMALAQTVAGVRQYNQLITLMSNWDYFQELVGVAKSSTGELDNQAKIFEESWLGASKRVQAAAEEIYSQLLKDDAFITMTDGLKNVLEFVADLINGLGGLKGVLFTIGTIVTKVFQQEMAQGLRNAAISIKQLTPAGRQAFEQSKTQAIQDAQDVYRTMYHSSDISMSTQGSNLLQRTSLQETFLKYENNLNDVTKKRFQIQLDGLDTLQKHSQELAKQLKDSEKLLQYEKERSVVHSKATRDENIENSKIRKVEVAAEIDNIQGSALDRAKKAYQNDQLKKIRANTSLRGLKGEKKDAALVARSEAEKQLNEKLAGINSDEDATKVKDFFVYYQKEIDKTKERLKELKKQQEELTRVLDIYDEPLTQEEAEQDVEKVYAQAEFQGKWKRATQYQDEVVSIFGEIYKNIGETGEDIPASTNIDALLQRMAEKKLSFKDIVPDTAIAKAKELALMLEKLQAEAFNAENPLIDKDALTDEEKQKLQEYIDKVKELTSKAELGEKEYKDLFEIILKVQNSQGYAPGEFFELGGDDAISQILNGVISDRQDLYNIPQEVIDMLNARGRQKQELDATKNYQDKLADEMTQGLKQDAVQQLSDWAASISQVTTALMSLGTVISSVQGLIDVLNNPDTTGWEKFTAVLTQVGFVIPQLMTGMSSIVKLIDAQKTAHELATVSAIGQAGAEKVVGAAGLEAGKKVAAGGLIAQAGWLPLLAISVAIIGLVALITVLVKKAEANKVENRLKAAQENTEKMAEAANEAKQSYENLLETINKYDTAVKSLNKLTVGTEAFNDALKSANNEARELIETYKLNSDDFVIDSNTGLIKINKQSLEDKKIELQSDISEKERLVNASNYSVTALQNEKNIQDIYKQIKTNIKNNDKIGVSGTDDEVLKIIAQDAAKYKGGLEEYVKDLNVNIQKSLTQWNEVAAQNPLLSDYYVELFDNDEFTKALSDIVVALQENSDTIKTETKTRITSEIESSKKFQNNNNKNELLTVFSNLEDRFIEEAKKDFPTAGNDNSQKVAELLGANKTSKDQVTNKTTFYKDGKEVGAFTADEMAEYLAYNKVYKNRDEYVGKAEKALDEALEAVGEDGKNLLLAAINGDASQLKQKDLDKILLGDKEQNALLGLTDEIIEELGLSVEDFKQNIIDLTESVQKQFDSLAKGMGPSVKKAFDKIKVNNLDISVANKAQLTETLDQIFSSSGQEGLNNFTEAFQSISKKDQPKFLELLEEIDWSKGVAALIEFYQRCNELGIIIKKDDNLWQQFAQNMEKASASNVIKDLDTIKSQLVSILEIIKDLNTNDIIDAESYEKLIGYDEKLKNLFIEQIDGKYKYVGTDNLNNYAVDFALASNQEANKMREQRRNNVNDYLNKDFDQELIDSQKAQIESGRSLRDKNIAYRGSEIDNLVSSTLGNENFDFSVVGGKNQYSRDSIEEAQKILSGSVTATKEQWDKAFEDITNFFNDVSQDVENTKSGRLDNVSDQEVVSQVASSVDELNSAFSESEKYEGAHAKGLRNLGAQYVSCYDELKTYNKELEAHGEDSEQAKKAAKELEKAIRQAEWEQLAKECQKASDSLEDLDKNSAEAEEIFQDLAKSINKTFDLNISKDFVKNNADLIKKWANSTGDEFIQLGNQIKDLAQLEVAYDSGSLEGIIDGIKVKYSDIQDIINNNPIVLTATGNADFTGLMQALNAAGLEAEAVAKILMELGYSNITLEGEVAGNEDLQKLANEINNETDPAAKAKKYADFIDKTRDVKVGITLDKAVVPREAPDPQMKTINGKKKNSGGGDGSDKKEPKSNKDEIERYHEIKNTLEDLEREYDRIKKARDRAYGMTKVALIQEEIEKTKELAEAQKQYMTEINDNLIDDQKALAALGATFDSRGNVNNYDSLIAGWVAEFNASLTDEAEKAYQDKVDALNQYEETHDLWQDEYDKLIDYYNQIVDLELEAITVEVDFKIELSEKEIERVEYEIEKLTRSRTLNIDIQINKMGDYIPEYMKQSKEYQDAIQKIYDSAMKYGLTELTQDQWDTIKDYQSKLLELNLKMLDKVQEVEEKFNEAIDKMTERFDEAEGRFETYGSVLEHFSDTMELLGMNTKDFATYQKLLQQRMDTSIATIDNNKKRLDTYNQALAETKEALARAVEQGDQENILFWQEKVRELETASEEAYEAFISSWQSTIEAATEFFESKVEAIIQHFKDNLFVDGLDAMADKLDKVNDVRERYLDDFDRWYEISKLNREIDKEIDDTSNLSAKRRLADFQKEILKYQEEGALMSQYDLDHARARYELLLAEIALEEARNAKNTVQLKRDSEGNWGYVYTADQDKIAEAEQNYEDKLHDMQEAAKEYRNEMESQVIDALNNMFEELGGLDKNAADYQEKAWKIYQFYYDKLQYLAVEFDKALADSNSTLADTVFADEGIMTDFLTYITNLMNGVKDAPEQLINQYKNLQDTIRKANESAGIDSDNFSNNVIINIDWVNGKTEDLAKDMDSFMGDISDSITKVIDTIQTWKETYLNAIRDMMAANEKWNLSSYEVPAGYSSWEDYFKDHPPEIDWDWTPSYTGEAGGEYRGYMVGNESNSGTSDSGGSPKNPPKTPGGGGSGGYRTVPLPERRYDTSDADDVIEEFYNYGKESQYAREQRYQQQRNNAANKAATATSSNGKSKRITKTISGLYTSNWSTDYFDWLKGSKTASKWLYGYATGGYTGNWGTSDGKVALLHEKELVLNKKDTANILDSVNIVRDMNNQINRNIRYASFAQQVAAQIKGQLQNELKQNVEIQATFPSVTNSNEIEDAFNNLVNAAAQYVNSKIQ